MNGTCSFNSLIVTPSGKIIVPADDSLILNITNDIGISGTISASGVSPQAGDITINAKNMDVYGNIAANAGPCTLYHCRPPSGGRINITAVNLYVPGNITANGPDAGSGWGGGGGEINITAASLNFSGIISLDAGRSAHGAWQSGPGGKMNIKSGSFISTGTIHANAKFGYGGTINITTSEPFAPAGSILATGARGVGTISIHYCTTFDGSNAIIVPDPVLILFECVADSDGDDVPDDQDNCPNTPDTEVGQIFIYDPLSQWYGCGPSERNMDGDLDLNGDPLWDAIDNCPYVANPDQTDVLPSGGDGIGDACQQDFDGDGINDNNDNCPDVYNPLQENTDVPVPDLRGDACDLCPTDPTDACASVEVTVTPADGGIAENPAGTASVVVPPGAVSQDTTIKVIGESATSNYAIGMDPTNLIVGYVYTFQPEGFTFNTSVTITLFYEQGNMPEGKGAELHLDIYYYDLVLGWQPQNAQQDMTNFTHNGEEYGGTLTIQVDHFSTYAVIALRDHDGDGVVVTEDACPDTAQGDAVNGNGCSAAQLCEADSYKNHGEYVSCVTHTAKEFVEAALITGAEKGAIVSAAAKSDVGKKVK